MTTTDFILIRLWLTCLVHQIRLLLLEVQVPLEVYTLIHTRFRKVLTACIQDHRQQVVRRFNMQVLLRHLFIHHMAELFEAHHHTGNAGVEKTNDHNQKNNLKKNILVTFDRTYIRFQQLRQPYIRVSSYSRMQCITI